MSDPFGHNAPESFAHHPPLQRAKGLCKPSPEIPPAPPPLWVLILFVHNWISQGRGRRKPHGWVHTSGYREFPMPPRST